MALSNPVLLGSTLEATSADNVVTVTVNVSADALIVLFVWQRQGNSTNSLPVTISDTLGGLTWQSSANAEGYVVGASSQGLSAKVLWAQAPATAVTGDITCTFTGNGHSRGIVVHEVKNHVVGTPVPQAKTNTVTATTMATVLAAVPAASSVVFAAAFAGTTPGGNVGADPNFVETFDAASSSTNVGQTQYRNGSAAADVNWSALSGTDASIGIAIEVAAAATGPNIVGQMVVGGVPVDMRGWIVQSGVLVEL